MADGVDNNPCVPKSAIRENYVDSAMVGEADYEGMTNVFSLKEACVFYLPLPGSNLAVVQQQGYRCATATCCWAAVNSLAVLCRGNAV